MVKALNNMNREPIKQGPIIFNKTPVQAIINNYKEKIINLKKENQEHAC